MTSGRHQVRSVQSVDELAQAEQLLAATFGGRWAGWRKAGFFADRFPEEAELMAIAIGGEGEVLGAALGHDSDDRVVLAGLAVAPSQCRCGIGAELLALVEESARRRGAAGITLGSVDEAVGFYLRRDYKPLLLVQFVAPQRPVEDLIAQAAGGPLAGLRCVRREFEGVLQLFVELDSIDFALRQRVEAELAGTSASFLVTKDFTRAGDGRSRRGGPKPPIGEA